MLFIASVSSFLVHRSCFIVHPFDKLRAGCSSFLVRFPDADQRLGYLTERTSIGHQLHGERLAAAWAIRCDLELATHLRPGRSRKGGGAPFPAGRADQAQVELRSIG